MILPIYVYGAQTLREETVPIEENSEALQQLIDDMIETMYAAQGIGLAAPQVGRRERLFVLDLSPFEEELEADEQPLPPQPMVMINPKVTWESAETCDLEEGCLSIPDVREAVERPERIKIRYLDRQLEVQELKVGSMLARAIQHEFDHLEGILFTDHISTFRRRLLRRRLREMAKGKVEADYALATA